MENYSFYTYFPYNDSPLKLRYPIRVDWSAFFFYIVENTFVLWSRSTDLKHKVSTSTVGKYVPVPVLSSYNAFLGYITTFTRIGAEK